LSERAELTSESNPVLPPILRAELAVAPLPRRPWYRGIAPAYLGIFIWAPFFDQLWARDLPGASLAWLASVAVSASILGFLLFYSATATWGFRTRRRLVVVAASTFGASGSEWITGLAVGAGEVVWYAVAIDYAIESIFLGLIACDLLAPHALGRWDLGPFAIKSPVFLCTAVFWIFITGMAGLLRLVGVIAGLMKVYAPVALLLLAATALWLLPGLVSYRTEDAVVVAARSSAVAMGGSNGSTVPMILGYLALVGLLSVDWGSAARRGRDVALGGLAGIVLAATCTATLSLLVVAGTVGRLAAADRVMEAMAADPPPLSFRWAVFHGIGGILGGAILLLFGLAALAPACYTAWIFTRAFFTRWPRIRRIDWTTVGGGIALLLIATSCASRLEWIDWAMGMVFAPAVGAMSGDFLRQRGGWAGVRSGFHPPGVIAWVAGLVLAPALEYASIRHPRVVGVIPPLPIVGFLIAASVYWLLAGLGLERPPIPLESLETANGRSEAGPGGGTERGEGLRIEIGSEPSPTESRLDRGP
jgi:hypothetical protein